MDKHGASIFGWSPPAQRFEVLAVCKGEKLDLVSHGKPLGECKKITKKCGLDSPRVFSLEDFALLS